jgi:hypothetical protein
MGKPGPGLQVQACRGTVRDPPNKKAPSEEGALMVSRIEFSESEISKMI